MIVMKNHKKNYLQQFRKGNTMVNMDKLIKDYKDALQTRNFVAMANLAALCIQEMTDRSHYTVEHFGVCPECQETDGCLHVGSDEWLICHKHKAKWYVGSNLLSTWREMTEEEFENNHKLLETYSDVKPLHILQREYYQDVQMASVPDGNMNGQE